MEIEPTLALFYDTSEGPAYWWIDVTLPTGGDFETVSHGTVPATPNAQGELHIDVNMQAFNSGPLTIQVDIGEVALDPVNDEVHIHLLDEYSSPKGGGIVRTEDAVETTRPIPPLE